MEFSFPSSICWIDDSFSIEWMWQPLKNQLVIDIWVYLWTLNSIPVPHCFYYCSFVATLKLENMSSLTLLFSNGFAVWEPLQSHDFESWIFCLCKESILLENTLNLQVSLGHMNVLEILRFYTHKDRISLCYFFFQQCFWFSVYKSFTFQFIYSLVFCSGLQLMAQIVKNLLAT